MPEGPEVHRCADLLRSYVKGKWITEAKTLSGKLHRQGVPGMVGVQVKDVVARGKVIFVELESGQSLVSTLGMSGWWYPLILRLEQADNVVYYNGKPLRTGDVIEKALKHSRYMLKMDDGTEMRYVDPRNFGNLTWLDAAETEKRKQAIGFDMLNEHEHPNLVGAAMGMLYLEEARKLPIGQTLLDQSLLAGIGNIYRAEALWLAGISPFRPVNEITEVEMHHLVRCIETVLQIAYLKHSSMVYGPSVLQLTALLHPGGKERLRVSSWVGMACYGQRTDMLGYPIKRDKLGGRTMWWSPTVQR